MRSTLFAGLLIILAACGSPRKEPAHPATGGVKAVPEGFHTVTAQLVVGDVDKAVAYYEKAFGARLRYAMKDPGGKSMHAEIEIGDSIIMLAPEMAEVEKSPATLGGTCGGLMIYVEDVDAVHAAALAAGGTSKMPVGDQFWGDRYGQVTDPFGHVWSIATHKEDLTEDEMGKRAEAWSKAMAEGKAPPAFEKAAPAKSWKPDGYFTVTPALVLAGGVEELAFYEKAFGATIIAKMAAPDGKLMHAELKIGDSIVMMSSEEPTMQPDAKAPKNLDGVPLSLLLYVDDADAAQARALEAGAVEKMPVKDAFWGDRWGQVEDSSGHTWGIGTHTQDLTPEQIEENMRKQFAPGETK